MPAEEFHIQVGRTARYRMLGTPSDRIREVWFVLHGFAQLAEFFIRGFDGLDDGTRLIVAPEALNRFYLDNNVYHGSPRARVGATWMTREDREADIKDYVGYLDTLFGHASSLCPSAPRSIVLGFSQGVATACRWMALGKSRAATLVLWAGPMPIDLSAEAATPLKQMRIIRVMGDSDDMGTSEAMRAEDTRFAAMGLSASTVRFAGGHQLDRATLLGLEV